MALNFGRCFPDCYRTDTSKFAGETLGCVSEIDSNGRTIWIADTHRDGKRFIMHSDETLTAFLELEATARFRN